MIFENVARRGSERIGGGCLASGAAILAASLLMSSHAYSQGLVTLYKNDFESPNPVAGETYANGFTFPAGQPAGGTYSADYNNTGTPPAAIKQVGTMDRLYTTAFQADGYVDTAGTAGRFMGGIVSDQVIVGPNVETAAMQFDPLGKPFLDLSMDWSAIDIKVFTTKPTPYWPDNPRYPSYIVQYRFYALPVGQTFQLSQPNTAARADVLIGGSVTPAVPKDSSDFSLASQCMPVSSPCHTTHALDWKKFAYSLDLEAKGFAPTDRVLVVWNLKEDAVYAAFDNVLVTSSSVPAAQLVVAPDNTFTLPSQFDAFNVPDFLGDDYVQGGGSQIQQSSVTILTQPTYGSLTAPDPAYPYRLVYTPDGVHTGDMTFTYRVCDNSTPTSACNTTPATVTLQVPQASITLGNDKDTTVQDQPKLVAVMTNDSATGGIVDLTQNSIVTFVTAPAHGTVSYDGAGGILYTPDAGYVGEDSFQYSVCNRGVCSSVPATVTMTITAVMVPPVATPVPTLGQWALMMISLALAGVGATRLSRRGR